MSYGFSTKMLPAASWKEILSDLENHSVKRDDALQCPPCDTRLTVLKRSDSQNTAPRDRHYLSELSANVAPLRITQTHWWNQMHADFDF
jgi:hypothetical protein